MKISKPKKHDPAKKVSRGPQTEIAKWRADVIRQAEGLDPDHEFFVRGELEHLNTLYHGFSGRRDLPFRVSINRSEKLQGPWVRIWMPAN